MDLDEPAPLVSLEQGAQRGLDRSVWFSYLPERDRSILADSCDANFDNHIDIYTAAANGLTTIPTTSDDYTGCPGERRTFSLTAGVLALIRVTAIRPPNRLPDGGACARTCTLGVDLEVSAREARRLKLVAEDEKQRGPLRIGHVGGVLKSG
jgi:hypothetical protein